jgi:diacylglycerol kinase (ATP)
MSEFNAIGGITRILRAFRYSWQGFRACYRHEAAFRQEVLVALLVAPLGLWLGDNGAERALLVGSWVLVMIVELLNSAVEATVDRFGPEHHALSGRAKDIGSAAVFLAISLSVLVWTLILAPRLVG